LSDVDLLGDPGDAPPPPLPPPKMDHFIWILRFLFFSLFYFIF
jgi:hypothetical protein